jgi:hypothetical protein
LDRNSLSADAASTIGEANALSRVRSRDNLFT